MNTFDTERRSAQCYLPLWVKVAVVAAYFVPLIAIVVATMVMFD